MTTRTKGFDASFADGAADEPLRLIAREVADLPIIGALVQDAMTTPARMVLAPRARRFAIGLNRFRWEDVEAAERAGRGYERVQSLLIVDEVQAVQSQGFDRQAGEMPLSVQDLRFAATTDDGIGGWLSVVMAGGAELRLKVEALEVTLRDVSRPYLAPSGLKPDHG